ncbi:MAG: hypothetical protein [Microviridae sp.]|nr:MAG: hypothetical protein [Microviridae sp.]
MAKKIDLNPVSVAEMRENGVVGKLFENGKEYCDPTPLVMPFGVGKPRPLTSIIARLTPQQMELALQDDNDDEDFDDEDFDDNLDSFPATKYEEEFADYEKALERKFEATNEPDSRSGAEAEIERKPSSAENTEARDNPSLEVEPPVQQNDE